MNSKNSVSVLSWQAQAERLAERAGKRAAEGHYEKAVGILKRALELQPSLHRARRDLAMAYVKLGDVDNATNHLIEVLRLNPRDAWSWVVLANLYIREKSDNRCRQRHRVRKAVFVQLVRICPKAFADVIRSGQGTVVWTNIYPRPTGLRLPPPR